MDKKRLRVLDKEDKDFFEDFWKDVEAGFMPLERIVGFKMSESKVYVPDACSGCSHAFTSPFTLLPLYDVVIMPIYPYIIRPDKGNLRIRQKTFKAIYDCTPAEMSIAAEAGRVIPYFPAKFHIYDAKLIEPFLEPGIPRISHHQIELIKRIGMCHFVNYDCKECSRRAKTIRKEFPKADKGCLSCLGIMYNYGGKKPGFEKLTPEVCLSMKAVVSRNLDAVFQTDCPIGQKALGKISGFPAIHAIEYVCKGLKIGYTKDIPLETYLEILDRRTTKAMRQVVRDILREPYARKYETILNAKIFEFNQQIEDFAKSKAAKIYKAFSDLAIYGGSKFVEEQTRKYIKLPAKDLKNIAEWIASKALDLHARVLKKNWTLAQLYRVKCKLQTCKQMHAEEVKPS